MVFFHCILTSLGWTMLLVTHCFASLVTQKHCFPFLNASTDRWEEWHRTMLGLRLWICQVAWERWNVLAWEEGQDWPDLVHFIEVEDPRKRGQWPEEMVWPTLGWVVIRVVRMLCKANLTRTSIFWTDFSPLTWTGVPGSVCSLDQQYQHHNLLGMYLPGSLDTVDF